ncbi:MAG TPA: SdrD B-like domain-containing protein [Gemmatimonadales bacterium]|nr:SdrD B-like domain-containing protein [Gemmatimonadales bacterium]
MSPFKRWARILVAGAVGAACSNAGAGRVLTISGVGQVSGEAYFDANGSRTPDAGEVGFTGVGVRLIATGTLDTVAKATTNAQGVFTMNGVAAGNYTITVDTTTLKGDTVFVTRIDTSAFTLAPGESVQVAIAIAYPEVPIHAIDTLPLNKKVFVAGVALTGVNGLGVFGDTTGNFADATGAVRVVGMRNAFVAVGDSDRVLGVVRRDPADITLRAFGFASLTLLTPPGPGGASQILDTLTTAQAVTANGGASDAALVLLSDTMGTVKDTATIVGPHGPYFRMHIQGTGSATLLEVRLDSIAGFFTNLGRPPAKDSVGLKVAFSGILVPTGTVGVWTLKPRSPSDQRP